MPAVTSAKTIAVNMLTVSSRLVTKDLEALPETAFTQSFGPKCRTVADIIHEMTLVTDHIGLTIRGEALFEWPDGWIKAPDNLQTKEAVLAAFTTSMSRIIETAESYTEEQILEPFVDENGDETNRFERFRFIALHNWYHSGQLNFIQTLLGDDDFHW